MLSESLRFGLNQLCAEDWDLPRRQDMEDIRDPRWGNVLGNPLKFQTIRVRLILDNNFSNFRLITEGFEGILKHRNGGKRTRRAPTRSSGAVECRGGNDRQPRT